MYAYSLRYANATDCRKKIRRTLRNVDGVNFDGEVDGTRFGEKKTDCGGQSTDSLVRTELGAQIRMKVGELVGKSTDSSHSNEDRPAGKKVGSVRQGRFRENSADSERKKLDKFGELVGKLTDSSDSKETQRTRKKVGSFRCS